jgi:dienelactone hydrolase
MSTLEETIEIAVEGERIAGTFVTPGTLIPGVLFVHGWGGSQEQYLSRAREVAELGCVCLTFDLRGHAQTKTQFETVSRAHNLEDVVTAYDTLVKRRHVDPGAIAVVGSSYGGYLAAILTSMRKVRWLALRAPALYIDSGWKSPKLQLHKDQDLRTYRQRLVLASENRALQAMQAFGGDVLLIESESDAIIPKAVLTSYREAATHARSMTYRCLDGADHGLTEERAQKNYSKVLGTWLKEMVQGSRRAPAPPPALAPAAAASQAAASAQAETPAASSKAAEPAAESRG